ncbi:MAG TPA: SusC/RagA family TonB-linked outer membrane protein [Flavisolibacter sp.]|nr:SusC/RagA family TonB-linked outer membrane protein [Flavisolibacter sp.]
MRKIASLFTMLMLFSVLAFAQTRTVTGVVRDDKGDPIPFATVSEAGTKNAVQADANGSFSIKVSADGRLAVSATGFAPQTISVTGNTATVSLVRTNEEMKEVVVTALGVRRKADNLSYAAQGVKSERLTLTRVTDVNNALVGKVAGVQVRSQSTAKLGSSSGIRIRGAGSITDKNALYVVDGTPIDDINAINMDDVDDIQVLKGPAATAIYGQRGDAGVILVTTKKARKRPGIGIEVNSSVVVNTLGIMPEYQNEYSGGSAGVGWKTFTWAPGMPDEWKALDGKKYHTYYDDASWGPKMDGSEYIPWYAWIPGSKYSFKTAKLTPQKNNIRDFYETGVQLINNVAFNKVGDAYSVRLSYTNQNENGLMPYSDMSRHSLSTQSSFDLGAKLTATANINYISQIVNGEFSDAYGNNASGAFNQWFHRDLDINILRELKDLRTPTGRIPSWNLDDFSGINTDAMYGGTLYWTNPFSYFDLISAARTTDRLFGDVGLTYKINSHFKLAGFIRRNQYDQNYETKLPYLLEISAPDAESAIALNENLLTRPWRATYRKYFTKNIENNYEFLGSYNQKFNQFTFDFNLGGNIRKNDISSLDSRTRGGLVVPDLFTISNSKGTPYIVSSGTEKIVRSLYGRGSVNWDDVAVLDFSLRNDWSSALPENANSYLYPSLGGSFIFTKYIQNALPWLSFGKVRGSWAQVGSDLDPYQLALTYAVGSSKWNEDITMTTPNKMVDPNIKPALSSAYEAGLDLRFLKNRVGFSGTFYKELKENEILEVPISSVSGFSSRLLNAGKIERKGIELTLDATPVQGKNFQWNTSLNWATNTSKVIELYPGIDVYVAGRSDYNRETRGFADYAPVLTHVVGGEWGQLRGRGIKKINGKPVLNADGSFAFENNVNFGSVLPDFTGGWFNQFAYKNFNLALSIDFSKGGKYYSLSEFWGSYSGLFANTVGVNDKGNPIRDDVAAGGGIHVKGVDADGKDVDMYVDALTYFHTNNENSIHEPYIHDASFVKLREVSLGYKLPVQNIGNLSKYVQNLQLSAFARNPWLIYTANKNFDPSEFVGLYGESGQLPPSRSYGVTLKVGF